MMLSGILVYLGNCVLGGYEWWGFVNGVVLVRCDLVGIFVLGW